MLATDAVIITTELTEDDFRGARANRLRSRLQNSIRFARQLQLNPVVVLGAAQGDDVLRMCPELEDCDFVFDPNYQGNVFSSIQAGLHAAKGASFILTVSLDSGPAEIWRKLDQASSALLPGEIFHVVKFVTHPNGDTHPLYPQLVTIAGLPVLRGLPSQTEWETDARIRVRLLVPHEDVRKDSNPS